MMAPVHPKPTSTASTGLRVVVTSALRPAGAALETNRRVWHALSMARHPFFVVVVGARETDHLPGAHVFVAAVNWIGEVALLGVLEEHAEEGFAVDTAVELDLAALEALQHFVLIIRGNLAECGALEILTHVFVDGDNGGTVELRGREAALIALFWSSLRPRPSQIIVIALTEAAGELTIQKEGHCCLDAARTDLIVWDQSPDRGFDEGCFRGHEEHISGARRAGWRVRRPLLPGN